MGLGPPFSGAGRANFWSVSCTLISHICVLSIRYASVQVWKHATMFARGLGTPMAGAWRKRRALVSCVLYVTARY